MRRWRKTIFYLLIMGQMLLACSDLRSETPLPTLAATAESLSAQGNLGQPVRPTLPGQPSRVIPTASQTSPPTPTEIGTVGAAMLGTAEIDSDRGPGSPTVEASVAVVGETAEMVPATPSVMPTATSTATVTPSPSDTPPTAGSTAVPVGENGFPFPRPPDVIWPSPTPNNFPVSEVPRHGVGVAWGGAAEGSYGLSPYSWTFGWNSTVKEVEGPIQHVPMFAGSPRSNYPDLEQIMLSDSYNSHNYWLVFNECEHQGQCNVSPPQAAQFFHDVVVELFFNQGGDPDADLIVGGVNAHPCGILWLKNFVDYYRVTYGELPVAGWHFHLYPEMVPGGWPNSCNGSWGVNDLLFPDAETAFNLWEEHANNALAFVQEYGEADDEVWFTEMGCLNNGNHQFAGPVCQAEGFMEGYANRILGWLNSEGRWVTRYAWYTNWDNNYWRSTHLIAEAPSNEQFTYSSLGYWYSQIVPAAAVELPGEW